MRMSMKVSVTLAAPTTFVLRLSCSQRCNSRCRDPGFTSRYVGLDDDWCNGAVGLEMGSLSLSVGLCKVWPRA